MIDIIMPVYNTPIKDLERVLDSIEKQTYKDFILYIIDDGSNEKTKEYLDKYASNKDYIIVKHIPNGGVSNARNLGIEISNNKYLAFVDSDDKVEPEFLNESYKLMEDNNLDLIVGGYNEVQDDQIVRIRKSLPGLHIYEGQQIENFFEKLLSSKTNDNNKEIGDCPTGRIYTRLFRRSSLGDLRFIDEIMSEDTLFMIDYMYKVKRIGVIDSVWYDYYINPYSISNATKKEKMINNINLFIEEIKDRMEKETRSNIKEAYQARIVKANNYIEELKN